MATNTFQLEQSPISAIRSLPPNIYLVHATNCVGMWGAGIAAELAAVFPAACREYKRFCQAAKTDASARWPPRSLAGQCLIIPPQAADVAAGAPSLHIVCLFTSYGFGGPNRATGKPGKDGAGKILAQTDSALAEFRTQLDTEARAGKEETDGTETRVVIYSPMFNSGAFRVPWSETAALIEARFSHWGGRWLVMEPPSK